MYLHNIHREGERERDPRHLQMQLREWRKLHTQFTAGGLPKLVLHHIYYTYVRIYIYIHMHSFLSLSTYIYIYIHREREREREMSYMNVHSRWHVLVRWHICSRVRVVESMFVRGYMITDVQQHMCCSLCISCCTTTAGLFDSSLRHRRGQRGATFSSVSNLF